jgi:hypothetical protein
MYIVDIGLSYVLIGVKIYLLVLYFNKYIACASLSSQILLKIPTITSPTNNFDVGTDNETLSRSKTSHATTH